MGKYDEAENEALDRNKSKSSHEIHIDNLRLKFMTLPQEQKELIREAKKEGIEWRGEDTQRQIKNMGGRTHFQIVIDEFREMRRVGVSEYRKRTLARVDAYERRTLVGKREAG